jgi:hypothetical protein
MAFSIEGLECITGVIDRVRAEIPTTGHIRIEREVLGWESFNVPDL